MYSETTKEPDIGSSPAVSWSQFDHEILELETVHSLNVKLWQTLKKTAVEEGLSTDLHENKLSYETNRCRFECVRRH